jgi:3-oxoacyl-[acyl-carrier protein] reductase
MNRRDLVFVAGASSDLGVALIRRLLESGDASILAHYHQSRERLDQIGQLGAQGRIRPICADFESIESVERMAADLEEVPDQIVYLPALKLRYERFSKFNLGHFDRDMNIQVRSAIALFKRLLPKMAELPRAKVVFVLSTVTARVPPKFMSMYTVVKHAQLGLMRALASEYAGSPITINAVSPTMIDTRFLDEVPAVAKEMTAAAAPRGRIASTDDVVGAIQFLLSRESDFITGVELPVTGGGAF